MLAFARRIESVPLCRCCGTRSRRAREDLSFLLRRSAAAELHPAACLLTPGRDCAQALLRHSRDCHADGCETGNLDAKRLNDCYAATDAFVFASRTETQGLVLLEAMAQSRPVVSTACLGTRTVLTPASGASVVEEDEDAFAAAVASVLGDPQRARAMVGLALMRN